MEDLTLQQTDLQGARKASLESTPIPELPGYELRRKLGEGSFGQVWAGVQSSTGQSVALKLLRSAGPDLEREVERLRQVSQHPYVVSLLDANLGHNPPFLVMPLLERSLATMIGSTQDHPNLAVERIVTWLEQTATALQYVHRLPRSSRSGRKLQAVACDEVTGDAVSNGRRIFVSATQDQGGKLYQLNGSETRPQSIHCPAFPQALACDSQRLAAGFGDGKIRLYAGGIDAPEGILQCLDSIRWLAWERDELLAFAAPEDTPTEGCLWRWRVEPVPPSPLIRGAEELLLTRAALSWNGSKLVVAPYDAVPWSLEASVQECLETRQHTLLLATQEGRVEERRFSDGKQLHRFQLPVRPQALRPDGKAALVCDSQGRHWREVRLENGQVLRVLPRGSDILERPLYSEDGQVALACRSEDSSAVVLFSPRPITISPGVAPRRLVLSPDGQRFWLLDWSEPGHPSIVFTGSTENGGDADELARLNHADLTTSLCLAPDGRQVLTSSSDGTAALWAVAPPVGQVARPLRVLRHPYLLLGAAFSPNGSLIVTRGTGGQVRVWDRASGMPLGPLLPHSAPIDPGFTESGQLVTLVQGHVRLWDLRPAEAEGALARTLKSTGLTSELQP